MTKEEAYKALCLEWGVLGHCPIPDEDHPCGGGDDENPCPWEEITEYYQDFLDGKWDRENEHCLCTAIRRYSDD